MPNKDSDKFVGTSTTEYGVEAPEHPWKVASREAHAEPERDDRVLVDLAPDVEHGDYHWFKEEVDVQCHTQTLKREMYKSDSFLKIVKVSCYLQQHKVYRCENNDLDDSQQQKLLEFSETLSGCLHSSKN